MEWKPFIGFVFGGGIILLALQFKPQTPEQHPPFSICHEHDGPTGLCVSWTNFWSNYFENPDADREGYAKKCLEAGKAVGTSDFTNDFDVHECLDSCPDGSSQCLIGKMAEPKLNRVSSGEASVWAAKTVRATVEAASPS